MGLREFYFSTEPDSPRAFVALIASYVLYMFSLGLAYGFGVMLVPIADDLDDGHRGGVSWISSVATGLTTALSGAVGLLSDTYPYQTMALVALINITIGTLLSSFANQVWQIILSFGIIAGTGISFALIPITSCASQWFVKWRGVAVGFAVSGSGAGNLIIPPILESLNKKFGWRDSLRIWVLITFVCCFWTVPLISKRVKTEKQFNIRPYLKDKAFLLFICVTAFAGYSYFTPFTHIVAYAEDRGVESFLASWILAAMGGSSIVGRTALGYIGDRLGDNGHFKVFKASLVTLTITIGLWPLAQHTISLFVFGIIYGMFAGAFVATFPVLMASRFGVENISGVLGVQFTALAFGTILGPSLTGIIYDRLGSYFWAIMIATAMYVVSTFFVFLIPNEPKKEGYEALPE